MWIFPQCLNPIQHRNNTTHPYTFCRLQKKLFPPSAHTLLFPPSLPKHDACSLSFIWYTIFFFCALRSHFIFTLMMGKTPAIERTTTSCRSFENNINIFKWIDDNNRREWESKSNGEKGNNKCKWFLKRGRKNCENRFALSHDKVYRQNTAICIFLPLAERFLTLLNYFSPFGVAREAAPPQYCPAHYQASIDDSESFICSVNKGESGKKERWWSIFFPTRFCRVGKDKARWEESCCCCWFEN